MKLSNAFKRKCDRIDLEEGKALGIEKGENKKSREIAMALKKRGMSIEEIAAITGMEVEEIKKIK